MKPTQILLSQSDIAGPARGAGLGPEAINRAAYKSKIDLFESFPCFKLPHRNDEVSHISKFSNGKYIDELYCVLSDIARKSAAIFKNSDKTLIFSGDHSNAGGLLSGICQSAPEKKTGVIWIDAHADLHTPFTTPSGNMHGMPLSMALGLNNEKYKRNNLTEQELFFWNKITALNKYRDNQLLTPADIAIVDLRDYEEEESALLNECNIFFKTPEQRKSKGIENAIEQALQHLSHCDQLYVSFDVDSMDAPLVQGTGTPVENGLSLEEAIKSLQYLYNHPKLKALEFTEINPLLDNKNTVAEHVVKILDEVVFNDA